MKRRVPTFLFVIRHSIEPAANEPDPCEENHRHQQDAVILAENILDHPPILPQQVPDPDKSPVPESATDQCQSKHTGPGQGIDPRHDRDHRANPREEAVEQQHPISIPPEPAACLEYSRGWKKSEILFQKIFLPDEAAQKVIGHEPCDAAERRGDEYTHE